MYKNKNKNTSRYHCLTMQDQATGHPPTTPCAIIGQSLRPSSIKKPLESSSGQLELSDIDNSFAEKQSPLSAGYESSSRRGSGAAELAPNLDMETSSSPFCENKRERQTPSAGPASAASSKPPSLLDKLVTMHKAQLTAKETENCQLR